MTPIAAVVGVSTTALTAASHNPWSHARLLPSCPPAPLHPAFVSAAQLVAIPPRTPAAGLVSVQTIAEARAAVLRGNLHPHIQRFGARIAANSCNQVALLVIEISIVPAHAVHFTIPYPCRETARGRFAAERRLRDPNLSRSTTWLRAVQLPSSMEIPRRLHGLGKLLGSVARACCVRSGDPGPVIGHSSR